MRMVPPELDPQTTSGGEKWVYGQLAADESRSDWVALHSQAIALHVRQMEGEADFVIIAPDLGVLVLEVKGCGRVKIEDDLWIYDGHAESKHFSPFKQASQAMYSIRDSVWAERTKLKDILFWSAVCFPFTSFTRESPQWAPWQVIDESRLAEATMSECVEHALEQARARARQLKKPWFLRAEAAGEPTVEHRDKIVRILKPDMELSGSPQARAKRIDLEIRQFTEQQFGALQRMDTNKRVIFDGPAGTGKTVLALEAARRGHAAGRRVLLLCFNNALAASLREQAAGVAEAMTIDDYMVRAARIPDGSPLFNEKGFWDVTLPPLAGEALLERPGDYDELVIDEAQDVLREQFRDVLEFSVKGGLRNGRWRFFGDFAHQAIFGEPVDLAAFCEREDESCTVYPLDENCRNSPAIATFACAGGAIPLGYRKIMRSDDGVGPEPCYYATPEEQAALLRDALAALAEAGFKGPQVVILSTRGDKKCVARSLTDQPWSDLVVPLMRDTARGPVADLHSNKIRYASIHRYKGLEARAVVLTDFERLERPKDRDLFYIGATRATQRLVVLAHERLRGAF